MEIGTEWIQIAIENGGYMNMTMFNGTFSAQMRWRGGSPVMVEGLKNVAEAINALDAALAEDAANEMAESGKA